MKRAAVVVMAVGGLALLSMWGWGAEKKPEVHSKMKHRWLFVWRQLHDPEQVDLLLADMPRAAQAGYNGLVLSWNVAAERREEVKAAAAKYHLELIPKVMGGVRDRNLMEGLPVKEARFVVHDGKADLTPDPAVSFSDPGFEQVKGDTFTGWELQEQPGVVTFADRSVKHGGECAVRIENKSGANPVNGCFIGTAVKVAPYREYRVSVWVKTEEFRGNEVQIKVKGKDRPFRGPGEYKEHPGDFKTTIRGEGPYSSALCFATAELEPTQDWEPYSIIFNSLDNTEVSISFGAWELKSGKLWWDDAQVEEVGLINVLRRPGTPVVVKGEDGTQYEEGKDYEPISDPRFNLHRVTHDQPAILLTPTSRLKEGQRLRASYYHPVLIHYGCSTCLTEPKVFEAYRKEVIRINEELHPSAFFMQHDEIRIANWCELCRSKHKTPGQLLADNVRQCVDIIKEVRPDAKIWVWNDMFDPFHNAHEEYYLVNGTWTGSWEGLPKEVGIANWAGHLAGKNCFWFAMRGHEQVLCGYYDDPGDNNGEKMQAWLKAGEGTSVVGAMYTTWQSNFDPLVTWAEGAWGKPEPKAGAR